MPRPPLTAPPDLSGGQAQYVLRRLIADRQVSAAQIRRYLGDLGGEIAQLERQLQELRSASTGSAPRAAGRPAAPARAEGGQPGPSRRRRQNLSPERREALRLQGHYLALIRQVPKSRRAHFKAIVEKRGKEAAIKALRAATK